MTESTPTETSDEATPRPLDDRPESEVVKDTFGGSPHTYDMHEDPEALNPPLAPAESGAIETVSQWRAAKCLKKLRDQVNALAPNRSIASDGTIGDIAHCGSSNSTSDHCPRIPDAGVGVVTAMDITHDPAHGCDAGAIAASIHASRDARVKYIIWNRKIANSAQIGASAPWTWRNYTGSNPHTGHVHVSVLGSKPMYDSESSWSVQVVGPSPNV